MSGMQEKARSVVTTCMHMHCPKCMQGMHFIHYYMQATCWNVPTADMAHNTCEAAGAVAASAKDAVIVEICVANKLQGHITCQARHSH